MRVGILVKYECSLASGAQRDYCLFGIIARERTHVALPVCLRAGGGCRNKLSAGWILLEVSWNIMKQTLWSFFLNATAVLIICWDWWGVKLKPPAPHQSFSNTYGAFRCSLSTGEVKMHSAEVSSVPTLWGDSEQQPLTAERFELVFISLNWILLNCQPIRCFILFHVVL